ncbi:MAG: DNA translocase FtsK 4TM domain-containing protein [Chloroflexota bacterium]
MAEKKSSPPANKTATAPRGSERKAPAAARPGKPAAGAAGSAPRSSAKSPAGRPAAQKTTPKPAAKPAKNPGGRAPLGPKLNRPIREGLSLDRKLDILGTGMALVGLLTLLTYLSPANSPLTGWWVTALAQLFGWGMYLFPFGLVLGGLWLVLRNFERIPQLALERLAGFLLLFAGTLAALHLLEMLLSGDTALNLAQAGYGGGYTGALITGSLYALLGVAGAVIVLGAWLLIALALSFDVTIAEMGHWLKLQAERGQDWILDWIEERRSGRSYPPPDELPGGEAQLPSGAPAAGAAQGTAAGTGAAGGTAAPGGEATLPGGITPVMAPSTPWVLPPIEQVLDKGGEVDGDDDYDIERVRIIEETLNSFGAPARVVEVNRGPTITQFGVEPDFVESRGGRMRVRVSKITSLADDLALALSARAIRIQAPVPGKGFVGIEVPNENVSVVALRDLMESEAMKRLKSPLRFALGLNVSGNAVAADLAGMPHLLIAGATGSGKSVCVNALISCLLLNNTPDDLRLVMVDPKRVELTGYNGIPHLLAPVVVDLEKVTTVLQWVTREMDMRYRKLAEVGCRNISEYNRKVQARGERKMPQIVLIVDELADLMMLAPEETERSITRLAQLARATGIHVVIATQRPSVDVVTGLIKANFPARIAFAVASGVDSRVILDQPGAERLLGRGDMLFQAPDAPAPARLQGVYVSDSEINRLVSAWQSQAGLGQVAPTAAGGIVDGPPAGVPMKQMPMWDEMEKEKEAEGGDPLMQEAIEIARRQGRASVSMLQRRLRIGYTRASRIVEAMEEKGIVGPPEAGTGTRQILDYGSAAPPVDDE